MRMIPNILKKALIADQKIAAPPSVRSLLFGSDIKTGSAAFGMVARMSRKRLNAMDVLTPRARKRNLECKVTACNFLSEKAALIAVHQFAGAVSWP